MKMSTDEVVTEIFMCYSHKINLILEGNDDYNFYMSVIENDKMVNPICAYGSERVIEIIEKIESEKSNKPLKILGIIDRDYLEPLKKLPRSNNILITDYRDLECMMIDSPAFSNIVRELGSKNKIKSIGGTSAVKQHLLHAGKIIGELRYYSQLSGFHWSFQKLDIEKILDKKTMNVDQVKLISHLNAQQNNNITRLTNDVCLKAKHAASFALCQKLSKYFSHDLLICRGHDLMSILNYALRTYCGTLNANEWTVEKLEAVFRIAYVPYFSKTKLHTSINSWINNNSLQKDMVLVA